MNRRHILNYYSYDCIYNPWLGGGGAYRDIEVLSRMQDQFSEINLYAGHYPGAKPQTVKGINMVPLGFGSSELVSRISYVVRANIHILLNRSGITGLSLSLYAPLFAALLFTSRLYIVLHHVIGKNWLKKAGPLGRILYGLELFYCKVPKHVILVNYTVRDLFQRINPSANVLMSANGYDHAFLDLPDKSRQSKPFILYVGRIDWFMKGLDLLLDAFGEVRKEREEIHLVVAGRTDKHTEKQLAQIVKDRDLDEFVSMRQNISEQEKKDLLSECLFFASPSRYEGWGIAALEANAAGKAAVVSQADGFQSSIKDGYSGLLVDVNVPGELKKAIMKLILDNELREQMNKNAREWARQFTWDAIAAKEKDWLTQVFFSRKGAEAAKGLKQT